VTGDEEGDNEPRFDYDELEDVSTEDSIQQQKVNTIFYQL
jgi:hypothetical protein